MLAQPQIKEDCRSGLSSHADVLRASTGVPPPREFKSHSFALGAREDWIQKGMKKWKGRFKDALRMKGRRIPLSSGHNAMKFLMCNTRKK